VPKLKTSRGAAKRFKVTGSGSKVKRQKAYANHILTKKSPKRKRNLRDADLVHSSNIKTIKRLIPYG
jgi:large subunit ribosomal protein L35